MTDKCKCGCNCGQGSLALACPEPVVEEASATISFSVYDLDCADCAAKLEKGLCRLDGVVAASVNFATARAKVTYRPISLAPEAVFSLVSGYGYRAELLTGMNQDGRRKTSLMIGGLDCADCAAGLEKTISRLPGVYSAVMNFGAGKLVVEHDGEVEEIIRTVKQAGYQAGRDSASGPTARRGGWRDNPRTRATVFAGVLMVLAIAADWAGVAAGAVTLLYAATAVAGGFHSARVGYYALRGRTVDMNVLMTVAIVGAAAIGEWSEGAAVAFLFSLGNTLQTYTMDRTRRSITALMDLAPPEALVRRHGLEQLLPVAEVLIGDVFIVKPGERIALDGLVTAGSSAVDQASITGESMPVEKKAGDAVYAGTMNGRGALEIEVLKPAADSTLARITQLVEEAQARKAPSQQLVDRFARYYTPIVLAAAAMVMVGPWLLLSQPFAPWFYKGLVLLVISCPCALVISTPVSIVAAIGNASRRGVLIKGGAYLESIGGMQAVSFDKTGTLTYGRPVVTDVVPFGGLTPDEVLARAAAVEKWSEHPLAQAIVNRAKLLEVKPITDFQALIGQGAKGELSGETIYVGSLRLFEELGHLPASYDSAAETLERQGKTVIFSGTDRKIFGMIAVADTLREKSTAAVGALRQAGMRHIAMITGDNRRVAESIGRELALDGVFSDLLPEDKVAAVKNLQQHHGKVLMVGDGVNDAPALAAADVGIAMGVAGTDTALETADIALMADDLGKIAYIVKLSRRTVAVIKQNIAFAVAVKVLFVILTFAGLANLWLAVFADMGASLLVTFNGMRLMRRLD